MTLPSSGALSMSAINAEFGRGNNLNAYRGTTWYTDAGGSGTFSSGAISFSEFYGKRATSPTYTVEYMIVAGGGSGAADSYGITGGGGAGGMLLGSLTVSPSSTYSAIIGAGAAGRSPLAHGLNGADSSFNGIVATGGGGGGASSGAGRDGYNGGSGGGASIYSGAGFCL